MADDTTELPNTPDPLRLDRCPDCGYLLTGLPEQGICPECGVAYNPEMIVLYGWATRVRGNESTARRGPGWWVSSIAGWLILLLLFNIVGAVLLVVWLIGSSYRRRRLLTDAPAPVQVRLFPEGFGQRDGVGPVKLRRWRANKRQLIFELVGPGRCRIRSWRHFQLVLWRSGVIDFEFDCDAETADRIQKKIKQWRGAVTTRHGQLTTDH
jgi:hypothetical protein